ncbi:MAG: glycosyl hydrolase [Flavobacteriales bacterium]|nr:glycosyl hydrolase [Flavobacteriales bacterium]
MNAPCFLWSGSVFLGSLFLGLALTLSPCALSAQTAESGIESLDDALQFRCIGPFRGGRSAAVTGVPNDPMTFYMGATGGGVWKTSNGGSTWDNISDGYFGGSIGAIAVSTSHPNVLYVGGGEVTVRGNVSPGTGAYKSVDGGRSWKAIGLKNSRHIPRMRIHPDNPDIVYAAVLGDLFKDSDERGVYKSTDGGAHWERVLFANARAGAVDLVFDPVNPEVLYASTWNVRRTPYDFSSGGAGSGLWKSEDGGSTWKSLLEQEGMPEGPFGIIGVAVSPVNPDRVWAIVENENGGVYRSDDAGDTWTLTNSDRSLRQRAWYYTRIYADTEDANRVYVMNVAYHVSNDGGASFESNYAPHGDHHDLWIAPDDARRLIIGDDGGAQVSYDAGESWSTYMNQPTAQFYRVTTDGHFPYRIYGAQQDNSAIRIDSRSDRGYITDDHWESTAGGESAHLAPDPTDNDIVFGGSYGGFLTRYDHDGGMSRAINVWPDNPMGYGAEGMKYRFQWNFPVFFSPHDAQKMYTCSQFLHASSNGGESWEVISPDLTKSDPAKLVSSGGPITKDNTGVEYYATIFAAAESPLEEGLLWCGSDDGLVHVSRNAGADWIDVTPKGLPEATMINSIEVDPHRPGGLYVAGTRYKLGDYAPYLYHTADYGQTWRKLVKGIDGGHFTRVIRADQTVPGLLYAGTEFGLYISTDDGATWAPFQQNLPQVPVTDLALKDNDLIVATQGRSFWLLDDLNVLWQSLSEPMSEGGLRLFQPHPTVGFGGGLGKESQTMGTNHPSGVRVHFQVPEGAEQAALTFENSEGEVIRSFATDAAEAADKLKLEDGLQHFDWDLRYPKADDFEGLLMWWGSLSGPVAPPGVYSASLAVDGDTVATTFEVLLDPRTEGTAEDRRAQFDFLKSVRDKVDETHDAIRHMRAARGQISMLTGRLDEDEHAAVIDMGKRLDSTMIAIEEVLYQTKLKSNQDMLNFPIKLNNKLAHVGSLAGMGMYRPTAQMYGVRDAVTAEIDVELARWYALRDADLPALNAAIRDHEIDLIAVPED